MKTWIVTIVTGSTATNVDVSFSATNILKVMKAAMEQREKRIKFGIHLGN